MANRRPQHQHQQNNGRRMDFGRNDRMKNFGRPGVSPWQGGAPSTGLNNMLPLGGAASTEATIALANNLINNLLQSRQNTVPSLLDMPIRRDFGPDLGRFDRPVGYNHGHNNRMGSQGNFRRTGNYHHNRTGDRMNSNNRKPFWSNDGPRNQNKNPPRKDADSKAKPAKESAPEGAEPAADAGAPAEAPEAPKTRYDDINPQYLRCHICNKSMWDGRSFENHLSGRAHAIMMQKTVESYALTADTMRQEFKIREMKRTRKTGQQTPRDFYCSMCDLYAADGAAHRTTIGHRKLKKYLHPACNTCHKEMPTRIELDEHRLTPEHLRNLNEKKDDPRPKPEVMVLSTLAMEQAYVRDERQRHRRPHDKKTDEIKTEDDGQVEVKQEEGADAAPAADPADPAADPAEQAAEDAALVLDYKEGDDLSALTADMIPKYSTSRSVGASFLEPLQTVQCTLCRKLLEPAAAAVHLRTWRHHQLFVRRLQERAPNVQQAGAGLETNAEAGEGGVKRPAADEESGNWKRRKTSPAPADDDDDERHALGDQEVLMKEEPEQQHEQELQGGETNGDDANYEGGEEWENTLDEILNEEGNSDQTATVNEATEEAQPEEPPAVVKAEPEPEPEPEPQPEPAPAPATQARPSPRGRGRGRGRRRV